MRGELEAKLRELHDKRLCDPDVCKAVSRKTCPLMETLREAARLALEAAAEAADKRSRGGGLGSGTAGSIARSIRSLLPTSGEEGER